MSSIGLIGAAITVFVIAALLYWQAGQQGLEHFQNPIVSTGLPRPATAPNTVPADLNKAPPAGTSTGIAPSSLQRPIGVPGAGVAPPSAMATRDQMLDLENRLQVWLDSAAMLDNEQPGLLTSAQRQDMLRYQGRLADVKTQLGTGAITDFAIQVRKEQEELKQQNAQWQTATPNTEQLMSFGQQQNPDAFLDEVGYAQFRGLFNAVVAQLKSQTQPNPLLRVRLEQLQVISLDLSRAEKKYTPPPIQYGPARLFLRMMMQPDQPLPTLLALAPPPAAPALAANPADVIGALRDIQWKLTVSYNPAEQQLKQAVAATLQRLQQSPTPDEVEAARSQVIALQSRTGPTAAPVGAAISGAPLRYDPNNLIKRATTLCKQVAEAFPHDAAALGCPTHAITDTLEAESTINIVCGRLRDSVPSVTPEQFNCPPRPV